LDVKQVQKKIQTPTKKSNVSLSLSESPRFAGILNSPAPSNLPLPSFSESSSASELLDSPSFPQSSSHPAASETNDTVSHRPHKLQPKKLFQNSRSRSRSIDSNLRSPNESEPKIERNGSLDHMSNQIKSMLNIENS